MYKTDLYDFNIPQIEEVLASMNSSTLAGVTSIVSVIRSYMDWALKYRATNISPLDMIVSHDWLKKFVDTSRKLLLTKEEIYEEIIPGCVNKQDAVIFAALFEGIKGKEYWELRNLKLSDIDFDNNVLQLHGANAEKRMLDNVSTELLQLILGAVAEENYQARNGETSPNIRASKSKRLYDNGHIVKPVQRAHEGLFPVKMHVIHQRITTIQNFFEIRDLTPTNITRSGMLHMAKEIYKRDGHFSTRSQFDEICSRYNVPMIENNGYLQYNWWGLKEHINQEKIMELYEAEVSQESATLDTRCLFYKDMLLLEGFNYIGRLNEEKGFEKSTDRFHLWERNGKIHVSVLINDQHQYKGQMNNWKYSRERMDWHGIHYEKTQEAEM